MPLVHFWKKTSVFNRPYCILSTWQEKLAGRGASREEPLLGDTVAMLLSIWVVANSSLNTGLPACHNCQLAFKTIPLGVNVKMPCHKLFIGQFLSNAAQGSTQE